jgi:2-isopropylmalate synthase
METDYGLSLPRRLQMEFSAVVQEIADKTGKEISSKDIWKAFNDEYLGFEKPFKFVHHQTQSDAHASEIRLLTANMKRDGKDIEIHGKGNGPIDAFMDAMKKEAGVDLKVIDYREHSVGLGADATAVAYLETRTPTGGTVFGVGMDPNIVQASLKAIVCAANRALAGKTKDLQG